MTDTETAFVPGLEGVVAAKTQLSSVDGEAGELLIRGYLIEEFASKASFEETLFMLWHDRLPAHDELSSFNRTIVERARLPEPASMLLQSAAKQKAPPMDALRATVDSLGLLVLPDGTDSMQQQALRLVACFPVIVASYWRLLNALQPLAPRPDLSYAANYLYMLTGSAPSEARSRAMATYFNTVADHGLNASTFTARVIISTQSDLISAVVGALGALKGPLHGGAPGPALDMVFDVQREGDAESYLRRKIEAGERFMGFGHRVYKVRDPRADVLAAAAREMYEADGDMALYELAMAVEQTALRLLEEYKPGRRLQTNVEFFTALLLHGLGLPVTLFTPTFAIGRLAGWTAHCFEQAADNRLIRPQSVYAGARHRKWLWPEDR